MSAGCDAACQNRRRHPHKPQKPITTEGSIWLTHWQTTQVCVSGSDGPCVQASDGALQLFQINGDNFPVGASLKVGIYSLAYKPLWEVTLTAGTFSGFAGGSFGIDAQGPYAIDCAVSPGASFRQPTPAFVSVTDIVSGRSAATIYVQTNCHFDL